MKLYVYEKFWGGAVMVVTADEEKAVEEITKALKADGFEYNAENLKSYELVEGLVVETDGE